MWNCNESTTNRGYSRGFPNTDERINTEVKYSHDSNGIESTCNAGDLGSIPGLRRNPGGEHSNTLQYSCLEDPHGQSSLAGYSPWGHKESDMTEWLRTQQIQSDKITETKCLKIDNIIWIFLKPCVHDYLYICVDEYMYIYFIFMEWPYMITYVYYICVC